MNRLPHYADLHADADTTGIALPGAEGTRRMGDDGTPEVAEFAPLEIAAALTISVEAATILQQDGSTDSHNARRALALGVLASPARAVQLIQASLTDQIPGLVADEDLDVACPARGQRGHHCGTITVDPEQLLP